MNSDGNRWIRVSKIGILVGSLCILTLSAVALAPRDAGAWLVCQGAVCYRDTDCKERCNKCKDPAFPVAGSCDEIAIE